MISQVNLDEFSTALMESIIEHQKNEALAIQKCDKYIITKRVQKQLIKSTKGWKLVVLWKGGLEKWVPLKDLKESHTIEVSEFSRSRGIDEEPAFTWWVPYTMMKISVIISDIKKSISKMTHKYGIGIPTSVKHAYKTDENNGNNFYREALDK